MCDFYRNLLTYYKRSIVLVQFFILIGVASAFATKVEPDSTKNSILDKPKMFTPEQIITGDTVTDHTQPMPGAYFTPQQDSAYYRARNLRVPSSSRFQTMAKMFSKLWLQRREELQHDPWQSALSNMQVPQEWYTPDERERMMYNYNLSQAQVLQGIKLPTSPGFSQLQIPLSSIAKFFGFAEDVSPTISYQVESKTNVEVVIYSTQAILVATIYQGVQPNGHYSVTWNGRDNFGRPLPHGDYIGEVRIGNETTVRKHIRI